MTDTIKDDVVETTAPPVARVVAKADKVQGQVNEVAAQVRKIKSWLEKVLGMDIDGDGAVGSGRITAIVAACVIGVLCIGSFAANQWSLQRPESDALNTIEVDSDGVLTITANEATEAKIVLRTDQSDDADDDGAIAITTAGVMEIRGTSATNPVVTIDLSNGNTAFDGSISALMTNYVVDTLTINTNATIGGTLAVTGTVAMSANATLTHASTNAIITVKGAAQSTASLVLDADAGADNADTWTVTANDGTTLSIYNHATEVWNLTSAGALTLDGAISGVGLDAGAGDLDDVGAISCVSIGENGAVGVTIDTGTGEITVDGRWVAVGPNEGTALMIDAGTATIGSGGTVQLTWTTAFGAAPFPTATYADGSGAAITYFSSVDETNAILTGTASSNVYWQAIGARP